MNERGFTLVELIAVIVILGLLAIITTPAYETISNNIKIRNYESKKNVIKKETIEYVEKYLKNETYDNNTSKTLCFTVDYLIKNGIITSDDEKSEYIENNVTGEKYSGNTNYISVKYDSDNLRLVATTLDEEEGELSCNIEKK